MTEPSLHRLLMHTCLKFPNRLAAIFDDSHHGAGMVTYGQVLETANTVTSFLSAHSKCGEVIGLYTDPNISLPAFILGILQVPAAYGPIDPHAPSSINEYFIRGAGIRIICVESSLLEHFTDSLGKILDWEFCHDVDQEMVSCGLVLVRLASTKYNTEDSSSPLAYALHTSGTTGRPKIVRVPHSCIVPNVQDLMMMFTITEDDVVFMASPLTFDPSVVEMFMTWSKGAALLIVPTKLKMAPSSLARVLRRNHVTVLQDLLGASSTLRILAFGGESCPTPATIASWRGPGNRTEFFNLYGITEVSSWASCFKIPEEWLEQRLDQHIPLGDALKDTILHVRDERGRVVHSGIGEVFIGGYHRVCFLGNEELQVGRDQLIMRATGDMVEVTKRGRFFLGRRDDQVKRHGKRTSLFRIKQVIAACPGIGSCDVIHRDGRLIAFYTLIINNPTSTPPPLELAGPENDNTQNSVLPWTTGEPSLPSSSLSTSPSSVVMPRLDQETCAVSAGVEELSQVKESTPSVAQKDKTTSKYISSMQLAEPSRLHFNQKPFSGISEIDVGDHLPDDSVHSTSGASVSSDLLGKLAQPSRNIIEYLRGALPNHAIPDKFVVLQTLPITRHGKVDTGALKELYQCLEASEKESRERGRTLPGRWEEIVVQEWKSSLFLAESDAIRDHDSFVTLGGDSFQALRLVQSLEASLGTPLPDLMDVLLHQTFLEVLETIAQCLQETSCQQHLENYQDMEIKSQKISYHDSENRDRESYRQKVIDSVQFRETHIHHHQNNLKDSKEQFMNETLDNAVVTGTSHETVLDQLNDLPTLENNFLNASLSQHPSDCLLEVDSSTGRGEADDGILTGQRLKRKLYSLDPLDDASSKKPSGPETAPLSGSNRLTSPPDTKENYIVSVRRGCQISHHGSFQKIAIEGDYGHCEDPSIGPSERSGKRGKLTFEESWRVDTGKCVDASPLVVCSSSSQTVYIGSHSHLFIAITMETGNVLWRTELGDRVESSACLSACGRFVIVGCYDHFVYCLSALNGHIYWKYETGDVVKCSPVCDVTNELVYIGSHDQHITALRVKEETFEVKWRSHCGGGSVFASPCLHRTTGTLIAATLRGNIVAFNKESGVKKWCFSCPKPVFSSPVAMDNGVLFGCVNGIMYCLSHTGIKLWTWTVNGPIFSSPCISSLYPLHLSDFNSDQPSGRLVIFGSHCGSVTCLDPLTGQHEWTTVVSSFPIYSSPFIFTGGGHRRVAVASTEGHIYVLDVQTGKILSETELPGEVFSSPIVIGSKRIIVGCRDDFVYCLYAKDME
ncbi:beta-alanine-activating enzyme-like isoform X2 [Lytechinus variegatus]|uniref:beta-alanine-activating enzyme-like isoform X2 n=1 Tax=Lytechinus variegatus TaxID=7654 RepID=UPI001BB1D0B0|nr:beta-alanine-activating enzyme-like isoform X2 [Lytechinus variegatus]